MKSLGASDTTEDAVRTCKLDRVGCDHNMDREKEEQAIKSVTSLNLT